MTTGSGDWTWVNTTDPHGFGQGQAILQVHDPAVCLGTWCAMHNPSDHHMRSWPMLWRSDLSILERVCPHGVGHPDPDDAAYRETEGRGDTTHGCDGCCQVFESQIR